MPISKEHDAVLCLNRVPLFISVALSYSLQFIYRDIFYRNILVVLR